MALPPGPITLPRGTCGSRNGSQSHEGNREMAEAQRERGGLRPGEQRLRAAGRGGRFRGGRRRPAAPPPSSAAPPRLGTGRGAQALPRRCGRGHEAHRTPRQRVEAQAQKPHKPPARMTS